MAKTIVVRDGGYVDATPLHMRPKLVSFVYSMASTHGWQIRVAGQHWQDTPDVPTHRKGHAEHTISEADWAMLMGPQLR